VSDRSPAKGLQALAIDEGAELIIVGSASRSRLERVLAGSVAEALPSARPCRSHWLRMGTDVGPRFRGSAFDGSTEAHAALDLG
jgi:Universal stress protein family